MKNWVIKSLVILLMALFVGCSKENEGPVQLAQVEVGVTSAMVEEGGATAFTFRLSERLETTLQVNFKLEGSATNGADYSSLETTLTIPANRLTLNLAIQTLVDEEEEGTEEATVTLLGTDNDAIGLGELRSATILIQDPPPPFRLKPSEARDYLVNPNATEETVALFYNLKHLSESKFIIGQQDAFSSFFGNNAGESDIKKNTGADPGLLGSDFMFITDDQNNENPSNWFYQQEQAIVADAIEAYNKGMINTFCWHLREPYEGKEFYTESMTTFQKENAFKSILPGGSNHEYYKQKLDKVAKVTKSMVGEDGKLVPIIFRPFHEFDGDWFWWGKSYCTAQEYISLWRFTVEYLRDVKEVNNMLFAFSPDKNFTTENVYLSRYPGDEYVDIMGMDNYGDFDNMGEPGVILANEKLQIVSSLALERVKVAALTETGYFVTPGQNNPIPNLYSQNFYKALTDNKVEIGFVMFWNNTENTYCIPPPGQSSTNDFLNFTEKPEAVLADDLPDMYTLPSG